MTRLEAYRCTDLIRGVAPTVLGFEFERERLTDPAQGRQDRHPALRRARNDLDDRLHRQRLIVEGCNRVDQYVELEAVFAKGLQTHAGRPTRGIAEANGDCVTLTQKAFDDFYI